MNKLEFKCIMDVLNISDIKNDQNEDIIEYNWNGFEICFSSLLRCAYLNGRIPYKVVQTINNKYPQSKDEQLIWNFINVQGDSNKESENGYDIIDLTTSEKNKYLLNAIENWSLISEEIREKIKRIFLTIKPNDFYINSCEISEKEGLLLLLTELQDYYIQKTLHSKNVIMQSSRQSELLADVYRKLIEQTSPYLTTDKWIKMSGIYIFEKIKNRQSMDEKDNEIRSLLNRFDDAVNPFINEKIELLDPSYYVDKLNINISSYIDKANFDIKNVS